MDPRIQYAPTSDGASIAFWALGEGPAVVQMPSIPFTHIQMEWDDRDWKAWYAALGKGFTLVRYDTRGCGMSSRAEPRYTLDAMIEDLRAVADRLGLERMGLIAPVQAAPAAIVFAVRYPERVSRMILWCGISQGDELRTSSFEAMRTLSHTDWSLFTQTAAHALVAGWENSHAAHRMAAIMREAASTEIHEAVMNDYLATDISAEPGRVKCPVLVAYRMQGTSPLPASARYLASAIPHAALQPFAGSSLLLVVSDAQDIAASFREFLIPAHAEAARPDAFGFQTLLYTDIEGHTAMVQRLGDERGRTVLREHERITRAAIESHHGTEVLATGDGFLVRFSTSQSAVECAAELQRNLADASYDLPVELRVRIGINAGEPILEGGELHGASVLSAKAISGRADGGQILVANVVRELVAGKGFAFADRGETSLPGSDEPVRLWELLYGHIAS